MRKYPVIINYPYFFNVGGIETYLFFFIRYCLENQVQVIWLSDPKYDIAQSFKAVLLDNRINRVYVNRNHLGWFELDNLVLREETYILLCTNPLYMCLNQDIIRKNPKSKFYPVYAIASEKGTSFYLEDNFHLPLIKTRIRNVMRRMIENWDSHNAVRCFNINQLVSLEQKYGIEIRNKESKVLGVLREVSEVPESFLRKKFRERREFTIITVSRFSFPHKSYLLGLIRAFGKLRVKYPQLRLQIIGYGPHKDKVIAEIERLPMDTQSSIELIGEVSPIALGDFYKKADLNVSVAAAASGGAREGTLTLVGRNFCGDVCEVYGFYDECSNMTTSLIPGNNVEPYIEDVLSMQEDDYVNKCLAGFSVFKKAKKPNPDYLFETCEIIDLNVSNKEIRQMKIIKNLILFSLLRKKLSSFFVG